MSKIIDFIKANLIVVISVVLILAFLPTGYIFSSSWNKKVFDEATAAYTKEKRALTSKGSINYSLPAVLAGEADLSESRAPNSAVTRFYEVRKAERLDQVNEVVERGTAFNQGDHIELVVGILPQAPDDRTQKRLGREMAEAIAGTEANPSVYQRKLQRLNAGLPPKAEVLAATLTDVRDEQQRVFENSNADGKMTPAQGKLLDDKLVSHRLGEYIGRSKALTFYCSTDAFVNGDGKPASSTGAVRGGTNTVASRDSYSTIPARVPPLSTIDESVVFTWLWDFWVISDVLDAAALANTSVESGAMSIPDAPVKSVELIRVSKIKAFVDAGDPQDDPSNSRPPRGGTSSKDKDAPKATFTGRTGGQPNSAFDIRTVEVVVVASSQDLPRFIDAIGKTNYMTVTDIDLAQVDVWGDLEQGYYYGDDHVVRAAITIESVWLRSWMTPIMPDPIKLALGVPVIAENSDVADD